MSDLEKEILLRIKNIEEVEDDGNIQRKKKREYNLKLYRSILRLEALNLVE